MESAFDEFDSDEEAQRRVGEEEDAAPAAAQSRKRPRPSPEEGQAPPSAMAEAEAKAKTAESSAKTAKAAKTTEPGASAAAAPPPPAAAPAPAPAAAPAAAATAASSSLPDAAAVARRRREEERKQRIARDYEQKVVPVEMAGCTAETCYPPLWNFAAEADGKTNKTDKNDSNSNNSNNNSGSGKGPQKPARVYPFTLDPFQRRAVQCLESRQSVLVSAHTSAGKTVVAEYAIAMALRDQQRVVYTSPIKALSNQKYRELHEEFKDVGLMTGDVTINPSASCLVMTTEILRNMLYRGSEVMREVAWVVFDEIHYMRDKERGVVWEETLILLPDTVRFVFLSATIPNAREFASWIARLHAQPCNVVYTDYRPTPLQHFVFPMGGDGLYCVLDERGVFKEQNFQRALAVLSKKGIGPEGGGGAKGGGGGAGARGGRKKRRRGQQTGLDISKIVRMIMERKYDPVIVFSFSKRECETYATSLVKLDFTTDDEKKMIGEVFNNAIDSLSDADKTLPQIHRMVPLLRRGIGIHHGGLLPILKELIEILFQEGLLKALFATETFAMGLNMPAKTVVFTSVRKFDGTDFRVVSGGEYIQMSGRAGRRGLDKRGIVIMMMDESLDPAGAKEMIKGHSDPLNSSFHLGYNMVLNLMRVEGTTPETLMRHSFRQYQQARALPALQARLEALRARRAAVALDDPRATAEFHHLEGQRRRAVLRMRGAVTEPINALPFLNPGRLVRVEHGGARWGWGVLVNFRKKRVPPAARGGVSVRGTGEVYIVDALLPCEPRAGRGAPGPPRPVAKGGRPEYVVIPVELKHISSFSAVRVYIPKDIRSAKNRESVGKAIKEVSKRFKDGLPLLDPVEDMKIKDKSFLKLVRKIESLENRLKDHKFAKSKNRRAQLRLYEKCLKLEEEMKKTEAELTSCMEDVKLKETLKGMSRVLRRLGHATADNVVALKGRVACEISSCDELVVSEIILSNMLNDLTAEQVVAVLSCLVFQERTDDVVNLKNELQKPLRDFQGCVTRVAQVIQDARLEIDVEEYKKKFKPALMDIVYAWMKGAKFADICKLTDIFEGTIIRCIRRLEELLRQMTSAAKLIGNSELEAKFQEGISKLKRDIIFAASLYL